MTDGIKANAENLSNAFGGSELTYRWADLYKPQAVRDANEIKQRMKNILRKMESENESI